MGRLAELEREPEDGNAELHFAICSALARVAKGTTNTDDARLLCYALNVDVTEIGLWPKHERQEAFTLLNSNPTQQETT